MVHLRQSHRGKRPSAVISVRDIPELGRIDVGPGAIRIGALTTLTALIEHPTIQAEYPVLPFTARYMASPTADLSPVLLVLDAEVGIVGSAGSRRLPLDRFFQGPGHAALAAGEIFTWVELPRKHRGWTVRYERLDVRRAMDVAIAGVAIALRRERVTEARVALGAVAPTPLRVPAAEAALVEGELTPLAVERTAELAMAAARPIGDVRATAEYRGSGRCRSSLRRSRAP
jgi:CO/xanthine dehydrogenase FAD-binding subunit